MESNLSTATVIPSDGCKGIELRVRSRTDAGTAQNLGWGQRPSSINLCDSAVAEPLKVRGVAGKLAPAKAGRAGRC